MVYKLTIANITAMRNSDGRSDKFDAHGVITNCNWRLQSPVSPRRVDGRIKLLQIVGNCQTTRRHMPQKLNQQKWY